MSVPSDDITSLLQAWGRGERDASDRLFPLVYDELRRIARRQLRGRRGAEVLETTAVVHEVYLKLIDPSRLSVRDRGHFYNLAARAMRQILVDQARRRIAAKRGGGAVHTEPQEGDLRVDRKAEELLALDRALEHLGDLDPRLARTVELRFFAGLSVEEAAEVLDVSARTVKREWAKARAFLHCQLTGER